MYCNMYMYEYMYIMRQQIWRFIQDFMYVYLSEFCFKPRQLQIEWSIAQ